MKIDLKNINLRLLFYTRRFLWLAIAMVLAGILIVIFAFFPMIQQVIDLNTQVQQENKSLLGLQGKIQALNAVNDLVEFQSKDKVELGLPSEKPLLPLIASVNGVAKNVDVAVSDIETSPGRLASGSAKPVAAVPGTPVVTSPTSVKTGNGIYETLTIQVTVKGALSQINQFIEQIEHSTPMINVSQIELTSLDKTATSSNTGKFEAKLNLTTYYFVKPISVGIDDALPDIGEKEKGFLQSLTSYTTIAVDKQQSIQGGGLNDLFGANDQGVLTK